MSGIQQMMFTGGAARRTVTVTVTADIQNMNLFANRSASQHGASVTVAGGTYLAGKTDMVLVVNATKYIGSASTGSYALTIAGFTAGDTVSVTNNGFIVGAGGSATNTSNAVGNAGGPAVNASFATSWTNTSGTTGGGGGSGATGTSIIRANCPKNDKAGGGGGSGGAGYSVGIAAAGVTPAGSPCLFNIFPGSAGTNGSKTAGGTPGGAGYILNSGINQGGTGGAGGGLGAAGGANSGAAGTSAINGTAGGAGGACLVGKSFVNAGAGITGGTVAGTQS